MTKEELVNRIETESIVHFKNKSSDGDLFPFLDFAVHQANPADNLNNLYLELGVYTGNTLMGIRHNLPKEITLYGFDTFTGLPEDWVNDDDGSIIMFKGTFDLPYNPDNPIGCKLIKGDVRDTLQPFLLENTAPISLIHFDMDIYSSTKFAIDATYHRYQEGTVLIFDDIHKLPGWEHHSFKALLESLDYIPYDVKPVATVGWEAGWASAAFKLFKK